MPDNSGYTTTKWNDQDNYECNAEGCSYATLDEADMKRHVQFHDASHVAGDGDAIAAKDGGEAKTASVAPPTKKDDS